MATVAKKKAGRPAGSKTQKLETIKVIPPTCKKCGSAEKEVLHTKPIGVVLLDGREFSLRKRRVRCLACGQCRFEDEFKPVVKSTA